jgi:L-ascorbate metabolism protein UlaG (beta-lactamase superfamily)
MEPEQAVEAHLALKARRMLPVHWGTFNLAFHAWDEPIKRAVVAGRERGIDILTPRVGEVVTAGEQFNSVSWWERCG